MRRLFVLVTLLALVAATAPLALAKAKKCANEPSTNSRTVKNLKAKGVSCSKAEKVAQPSGSYDSGTGFSPSNHYKSNNFKCKGSAVDLNGSIWTWTCKHNTQKITFDSNS